MDEVNMFESDCYETVGKEGVELQNVAEIRPINPPE